jgi:hypothetical protein
MYSELQTESKEEALNFMSQHLDHEYANVSIWCSGNRYVISVAVGHELPPSTDSDSSVVVS